MIFWSSFHPRRKLSASRTRVASRSKPSRCHRILWRRLHPGHPDVGESHQTTSFFISASFGDASKCYRCAAVPGHDITMQTTLRPNETGMGLVGETVHSRKRATLWPLRCLRPTTLYELPPRTRSLLISFSLASIMLISPSYLLSEGNTTFLSLAF